MGAGQKLIGRTIAGRFRITGFIGEGAMAAVYRGVQDREPRDVAIKIMHPQLLGDQTFVARFRREAKAAALLKHPSSVQIFDYGVEGHFPYIVMELLTGQDLFDVLAAERRVSEARAARIVMGVCEALEAAHKHGIVHRDLKPENVMVERDPNDPRVERVKVLDFGIAKIMETGNRGGGGSGADSMDPASLSAAALTTVGVVVGTPAYMSPEQCKGDPVDGRSDIYACGILLFLLVTGRLPFPPTNMPWEVALDHIRKPPPAPSTFLPLLHPGLESIILTALSKWPALRQQSASELRAELEQLLPELPDKLHAGGAVPTPAEAPDPPMPSSIRARVEAAPPLRDVALPDPPPASEGRRPAPPSYRADTETRKIQLPAAGRPPDPLGDPPETARSPGLPPGVPQLRPEERVTDPEATTDPIPADVASSLGPMSVRSQHLPPISGSPVSDQVPSSEMVIHHRSDINDLLGKPQAPGAPDRPPAWAPPPDEAPAPLQRKQRRPPVRPNNTLAVRLMVPLAVVIGVALGVLAFLMTR